MKIYDEGNSKNRAPNLLYCSTIHPLINFIKDGESWEDFEEGSVQGYLSEGTSMLVSLLEEFVDTTNPYNPTSARELRFMLEALIEIREVFSVS